MAEARQRLLVGAIDAIREHGIAGVSARRIAAAAGVSQALVFYHFGSVGELLAAACATNTAERVAVYAERFSTVGSLRELLDVGRVLHARERRLGNVSVLAQLLAGAQNDPQLAAPTAAALRLWVEEIESVLHRVLAGSPLADTADIPGLARAVSASFIGLELYEGVDPAGAGQAMTALEQLAGLVEIIDDLGPLTRRAMRNRLDRATRTSAP
jgi:AcrR family transcriptional regulator